jgi:hypothetical protein
MAKGGVKFKVKATGMNDLLDAVGRKGARELTKELDDLTGKHALLMVNDAKQNAPYDTGKLQGSIDIYDEELLSRTIGSDLPYAQRQEYEHKSKKGFFRKAIWRGRQPFRDAINSAIKRRGR